MQARLYEALTSANDGAVVEICDVEDDEEVTALAAAGRLDPWSTVLRDGATLGLTLSGQDALIGLGAREAWSTGIETPASGGGTLLCTQRWVNAAPADTPPVWRLAQHRTIPFVADVDAAAVLRCDRRGCCALQRAGQTGPAGFPGDGRA